MSYLEKLFNRVQTVQCNEQKIQKNTRQPRFFVTIEQGRNVHQWKKVKNKFIQDRIETKQGWVTQK